MSVFGYTFALKMQEPLPLHESFERIGALLSSLGEISLFSTYTLPEYGDIHFSSWKELAEWVQSNRILDDEEGFSFRFFWPGLEAADVGISIEPTRMAMVGMDTDEYVLIKGEEAFFDQFADLAKAMTVSFPTDFAVAAMEGFWGEYDEVDIWEHLETNFALNHILVAGGISPEDFNKVKSIYDYHSVLPSFIILSRERYEASKPYLPNMPLKFYPMGKEPVLWVPKKPVIKRIEELSNGAVFLFIDYPLNFEAVRRLKKKGYWDLGL